MTALLSDGPYMFTSLLFSYVIKFLTNQQTNYVIFTLLLYFILKIISKIARIANYHATKLYYNACYQFLQSHILDMMETLDYDYFTNANKSHLLNIVNLDIKELADFGTWLSRSLLLLITFLVSIIILWQISLGLMIFGVVVNGSVIYILNRYNDKYEKMMYQTKQTTDKEMGFFSQMMNGIQEIHLFSLWSSFKQKYFHNNEEYLQQHDKLINNNIMKNIISPTITMLAEIILMAYAIYHCLIGTFGIETVLIIQSYFGNLFGSLSELVATLGDLRLKKVSIDRYNQFLNNKLIEKGTKWGDEPLIGQIQFNHVTFSYAGKALFKDLNITIQPGQITGLIGKSGSGKSTILKLLLGFIQPDNGKIELDDQDISHIKRQSLTHLISIVNQNPFIFNMTIYENLALINPDIKAIEAVCKTVHLYDYIMSLPKQFDTLLNENATDLSGGQKQRLAIARVLLKNPKVILLDEITSALDEMLSEDILSFLNDIKKEHTILMITHRSKEYQLCDTLIDLNQLAN